MSHHYSIIGVEGPHDQAFVGKLLRVLGFQDFRKIHQGKAEYLDPFWRKFTPQYPKNGDLYARLDMPSILFTETHSIAIYCGGGSNLSTNLDDILFTHPPYQTELSAFAIIVDADKKSPKNIAQNFQETFKPYFSDFPSKPGIIADGKTKTGMYILPDNNNNGVLDSILLKCGKEAYTEYITEAENYISKLDNSSQKYHKFKNFDKDKAIIASVVSVLKPGKTNTVSIADNNWISEKTIQNVIELASFIEFLKQLLDLT
ncbi:DUF3226 domain-containing protein [Crocosphaera sp. UHCC 0190]|uniref:DUF3226 domain-containing protein n=1 Tax=Crocosphaera sp. UHCC 0190 TaxID=3110246 RepID=UPI002B2193A4|nr:DUF3226 domain-containing protein [Crocosphaera sp. UHCC 0190]MEA5509167.1 DUF3226 domain-containing protein [Crocosphaera sp. UHCC 0190]